MCVWGPEAEVCSVLIRHPGRNSAQDAGKLLYWPGHAVPTRPVPYRTGFHVFRFVPA